MIDHNIPRRVIYMPINAPMGCDMELVFLPFFDAAKPLRLSVRAKYDIIYRSSQLALTGKHQDFFTWNSQLTRFNVIFLQTRQKKMSCESWILLILLMDFVDEFRFIDFVEKLKKPTNFSVGLRHGRWVFQRLKRSWSSETSGFSTVENFGDKRYTKMFPQR